MAPGLHDWLKLATRHLAKDSAAKVRSEISDHYEFARGSALAGGSTDDDAEKIALSILGDAKAANCQYRKVLLTSTEAAILHEGSREARAVCSRLWLKWLLLALPFASLGAASALFLQGKFLLARDVLTIAIAISMSISAPFLPIYTPARGRVFRLLKWASMAGALLLLFRPATLQWSWLLISCLWPLAWTEWTRASIRRKLPIWAWPKHLYL